MTRGRHFVIHLFGCGSAALRYYQPKSNRVALFESSASRISTNQRSKKLLPGIEQSLVYVNPQRARSNLWMLQDSDLTRVNNDEWFGTIQDGLRDTMIHEATHQVAFNTGLHSRIGDNPHWVVEGLATVFEAPGVRQRNTTGKRSPMSRINRGRFVRFQNYSQRRREAKSLESFIAGDKLYRRSKLDFYSQAWALSFYLLETRSSQYAGYLKISQLATRSSRISRRSVSPISGPPSATTSTHWRRASCDT